MFATDQGCSRRGDRRRTWNVEAVRHVRSWHLIAAAFIAASASVIVAGTDHRGSPYAVRPDPFWGTIPPRYLVWTFICLELAAALCAGTGVTVAARRWGLGQRGAFLVGLCALVSVLSIVYVIDGLTWRFTIPTDNCC
jgi:hypothetical protein